jgi:hypothetical protein
MHQYLKGDISAFLLQLQEYPDECGAYLYIKKRKPRIFSVTKRDENFPLLSKCPARVFSPGQFPHLFDIAPVVPPVIDRRLADQREP